MTTKNYTHFTVRCPCGESHGGITLTKTVTCKCGITLRVERKLHHGEPIYQPWASVPEGMTSPKNRPVLQAATAK